LFLFLCLNRREILRFAQNDRTRPFFSQPVEVRRSENDLARRQNPQAEVCATCGSTKNGAGPLRRVELDPEPPVKSGRPAPAFRLSLGEPKSAAGHAHGPSDSGTRRFSIGSKDRRVHHLRCRPTPNYILAKLRLRCGGSAWKNCGYHTLHHLSFGTFSCGCFLFFPWPTTYVYAIANLILAASDVSRNRWNIALGSAARSS
jgi:hypothetical protein